MVGIPRSKGCRICVQRRVRCDLTRPICNNCKKGNRPCPGYDSDLRIHDEGSRLRKRFAQKDATGSQLGFDSESPATSTSHHSRSAESSPEEVLELIARSKTPDLEEQLYQHGQWPEAGSTFADLMPNQVFPEADTSSSQVSFAGFPGLLNGGSINLDMTFFMALNGSVYSPYLAQEQLLSTFSSSLSGHGPLLLPPQMRSHQNWLSQLPRMFGSKLLDTTIRAVSLVHLGRVQQSEVFVQESRRFYGNALRLLNKALTTDTDGMSTETLSATILLSFYEMFASDSNDSWVRHSGGAGLLMRLRGPTRHLSGLDRDVYLAYRHTIIIDAFMRDEPCFLAEPQWLEMAERIHNDLRASGIADERLEIFELAEEFYLEHVQIPTTLRDARHLEESKRKMTPDQYAAHTELVLARARLHRANLKSINLRFRAALMRNGLETSSMDTMDPVFPKQYVFANVFVASQYIGHWTIMLILNLILKDNEKEFAPEKNSLYLMENREMCRDICRTTPFMLTSSFLGPFFVIFALRLCLMVFEPGQERDWVVRKLTQIGDTHMKMAADIPTFEPEHSLQEPDTQHPDAARLEEFA
ncbi:hypothetical protein A1O7_04599 [Cladophialophora yegresii CBS 114405]|uniref:Zn(2)-C6 fungal-type domain-containing protein n=1 Tax=Cladophialophora yegresii CBS 114405 TaxID=1182544 RepID=W9W7D9_9EURO|nr:uncharacterized protein A1O7_04599 [Cladophialophora yegresii CBS 114405]EXJ60446.1 hypothetical protein A1O7_04599 [Cladophialophora yegresii CBS 114405]